MRNRKRSSLGLAAVAMALSVASCATEASARAYYDALVVADPDLSAKPDGIYPGQYSLQLPFGIWVANPRVEVEVSIQDHRYADVSVTGPKGVESFDHLRVLRGLILERQSLQVDALSGATSLTGKAYLKAIESALD